MKKFIIERELPGAGKLTPHELHEIAKKSCGVIDDMNTQYHWIQTFVTDNKLYCVHIAPTEADVVTHATQGGFPVTEIHEIRSIIDPTAAIKIPV